MVNMGFGKDRKGVIFRQEDKITLLTLVAETALKQDNPPAVVDSFRLIKSEGRAHIEGATFVDGDGSIGLYLASDDLSVAEIIQVIGPLAGIPLSRGDIVGAEQSLRPVWYLGQLQFTSNDGVEKKMLEWSKTIRWTFGEATAFTLVAYNYGSSPLTTGATLSFNHVAFGVWVGA